MAKSKLKIINIMLSSINGKIAFHPHESSLEREQNAFTSKPDFERMRRLVAQCDAVFIGARSIETEKGAFRVEDWRQLKVQSHTGSPEPEWIIFTQSGDIAFQSPFWKQHGIPKSLFFVSSFDTKEEPMLTFEEKEFFFGKIHCYLGNITGLIQHLIAKKFKKAALLGGGRLNGAFWDSHLVDELSLTISPFVVGGEEAPDLFHFKNAFHKKLQLKDSSCEDGFVFLDYEVE
jgi:riboflavin biosynthesis pyrimidine reductase